MGLEIRCKHNIFKLQPDVTKLFMHFISYFQANFLIHLTALDPLGKCSTGFNKKKSMAIWRSGGRKNVLRFLHINCNTIEKYIYCRLIQMSLNHTSKLQKSIPSQRCLTTTFKAIVRTND